MWKLILQFVVLIDGQPHMERMVHNADFASLEDCQAAIVETMPLAERAQEQMEVVGIAYACAFDNSIGGRDA